MKKKKKKKEIKQKIKIKKCEAETKPLRNCDENNVLFQILPACFQKNQKKTKQISTNLTSKL